MYDSGTPLLGIYQRDIRKYVYTGTYVQMFIMVLFIIARKWKQTECPSASEWISTLGHIHTHGSLENAVKVGSLRLSKLTGINSKHT